jgi:hypothetical protein
MEAYIWASEVVVALEVVTGYITAHASLRPLTAAAGYQRLEFALEQKSKPEVRTLPLVVTDKDRRDPEVQEVRRRRRVPDPEVQEVLSR